MATYTININSLTMAGKDTDQDDDRLHDQAGFTWTVDNGKQHTYNYTTNVVGGANFQVNTAGSASTHKAFLVTSSSLSSFEVRGDRTVKMFKQAGIGDDPQPTTQLQVYGNGMDKGISVEATNSASKGITATSSGANGTGGQFVCQASGGTGLTGLGDAIGIEAKVVGASGVALTVNGKGIVQDYNTFNAKRPCASFEVNSTTGFLMLPRMTTTQRDAVSTPEAGAVLFNTTTNQYEKYDPVLATWVVF